jgi:ribosomal-protein-alanine N-acetyltransferase
MSDHTLTPNRQLSGIQQAENGTSERSTGLSLRYMKMSDIHPVVAIDRLVFDPPWSAESYAHEIKGSNYSHMVVLERYARMSAGWRRWLPGSWFRANGQTRFGRQIVGYGGLWHIADEAHISTIATDPRWRRQGYGEILLAVMIQRALTLKASYVVLEVRASNRAAQNLYRKYDFQTIDTKRNYYQNNREDAYDMRLYFDETTVTQFNMRMATLQTRYGFRDRFSTMNLAR